jgi:hypothetical protein
MFKAVLLRELEGWSDRELRRKLNNPELAKSLGFDPKDLPCRTTFQRARTKRFKEVERVIQRSVEQIHKLSQKRGSPIGNNLRPKESDNTSQRSKHREIRRRTRDVLEEMENVVFPELEVDRPDGAIYEKDDLLMVEALACALNDVGLNGAARIYGNMLDPEAELDESDPFYEDGPSGETVIEALKALEPTDISEMINRAAQKTFTRAKPYQEFPGRVFLAIDITYIGYYGDREGLVQVQGAPKNRDKEFEWCYKFATANIVGKSTHFVVAMLPVGDPDHYDDEAYAGKPKSHRPGAVVRDLLEIVEDTIAVETVYADKEFYAAESIAAFEDHDVDYLLPVPSNATRGFGTRDDQVTVKHGHGLYGPVKHKVQNARVETTLVAVPPDDSNDSDQVFATNISLNDETPRERAWARVIVRRYRWRGGIETAYSKIKEFCGMTTSRSFPVRLFHFGMGVLLYNMWLLVDFLVQVSMDVEVRSKPRVPAEEFRERIKQLFQDFLPG